METWMVVVQPETGLETKELMRAAAPFSLAMKEACFGLVIEGEKCDVRRALDHLRSAFMGRIFIKRRGFSIADTAICRSTFNNGRKRRSLAGQLLAIS